MKTNKIEPSGKYKLSTSAKLMNIGRTSLYRYIEQGVIKTELTKCKSKTGRFIKGIEIIKFNKTHII